MQKTAGEYTLLDGTRVWVQTIGDLDKELAIEEAQWVAREHLTEFRPGGSRHKSLKRVISDMAVDQQAQMAANLGYSRGTYLDSVDAKFPPIEKPVRTEKDVTEEQFMKKQDKYTKDVAKRLEDREKLVLALYDDEVKRVTALSSEERLNLCLEADLSERYGKMYSIAYTDSLIYYVVRVSSNHDVRFYSSIQNVRDNSQDRAGIMTFYNEQIDTVRLPEIPL